MAADVRQPLVDGGEAAVQGAAHLGGGVGGHVGGLGLDQVDDGLRPGQVHLPVEEGPLSELPGPGDPGSGPAEGLQPCTQHGGGAVALELHRVLAGVGVGAGAADRQTVVKLPALQVVQGPQHQLPGRDLLQACSVFGGKHFPRQLCAARSGQPQDSHSTGLPARGNGGDHV